MNRTIHLAACAFLLLLVLCFCSAAYRLEAHYTLAVGNRVGLTLGRYDATQPLIIDPVLVYSTYIGGSGLDAGNGIAVDSDGNAYVTGGRRVARFSDRAPAAHQQHLARVC
jgi:Beta-propeller repeat